MKEIQIKKKHHYVWSYYLKGWATDGVNVWYISKKGKPSFDSVKGIGCENHFYNVGTLSENDIKLIHMWLKNCEPELKKLHLDLVGFVRFAQQQVRFLELSAQRKLDIDLNDIVSSNLFENYMSMQENSVLEIIRKLREGDVSCLDDKNTLWSFGFFLGHQLSRTKRMRDIILWSVENSHGDELSKNIWMEFHKKHWWFMCAFIGANLSKDISLNPNKRILLLDNLTNTPFITSDQPVININPHGHLSDDVDYYYPLSDKRALLIKTSKNFEFDESINDESIIHMLNKNMANTAGDTIFSSNENTLGEYRSYFIKRKYKFS